MTLSAALAFTGCGDGSDNPEPSMQDAGRDSADGTADAGGPRDVSWADVAMVFENRNCTGCHGTIPDTYQSTVDHWIEGDEGDLLTPKMEINHRVDDEEAATVIAWVKEGYPEE
jgi:hypothetical protein